MFKLMKSVVLFLLIIGCKNAISQKSLVTNNKTKVIGEERIWSLDWSPNGKYIAFGNVSGLLWIYDADDLTLVRILKGFKHTINGISWSPDNKKIVASGSSDDPRVIIWDLEQNTSIIIEDHKRQVRAVQWSPKGTYFASSSHDGTIRIWNSDGEFVKKFKGAHGGCVGIDWLNEEELAASCWDNTIRTYSLKEGAVRILENGNHRKKAVLSIDWHPDGTLFATGDYGNENDTLHTVKLWTRAGELKKQMNSHKKEVRALAWNFKGDFLATGGETVRIWDKEGGLLKVFNKNESPVWSLDWDKRGTKIASGHNDGVVRVWNLNGELLGSIDTRLEGFKKHTPKILHK